jgi:hypothetical protein
MSFPNTGPIYALVKVYSSSDGSLLTQRQDSSLDTVYDKWKITVKLPVNRNYKGTLTLYNADGTAV